MIFYLHIVFIELMQQLQFLECKLKTGHFLWACGSLFTKSICITTGNLNITVFYLLTYLVSNYFSKTLILMYPHGVVDWVPLVEYF